MAGVSGMRIEGPARRVAVNTKSGVRTSGGGGVFEPYAPEAQAPATRAQGTGASTGIETLLALQAVEDPVFAKKKTVRRGLSILDVLEDVKADLLMGRVSEGRLNRLLALVQQAHEKVDPELSALINDIELRARVELAKLGHYPG